MFAGKPSLLAPGPTSSSPQRNSPFRRPVSPAVAASPTSSYHQQTTPSASPTKAPGQPLATSASLAHHSILAGNNHTADLRNSPASSVSSVSEHQIPRRPLPSTPAPVPRMEPPDVPPGRPRSPMSKALGGGDALSQLEPAQMRMLREGFQVLDRDNDGVVGKEDVAMMLSQLGLPCSMTDVSEFFPPSGPQTLTLPAFLHSIASTLGAFSQSNELLSAFSAFDENDDGQADLAELRDALIHTVPDPDVEPLTQPDIARVVSGFTARRAFNKHQMSGGLGKRGEIFKYENFVHSIVGGTSSGDKKQNGPTDGDETEEG